jgi:hypothetical protein
MARDPVLAPPPSPDGASAGALAPALDEALEDEYRARARYSAILEAFGPVAPFVAIASSEQRHIDALLGLYARYGLPVPPDRWTGRVVPPGSLAQACADGVKGEIDNIALYERLLTRVPEADVRAVFVRLHDASLYAHLPAFQRCLAAQGGLSTPPPASSGGLLYGLLAGAAATWLLLRAARSGGRR